MAYVYILHSEKLDRFYTGSCLDLGKRLLEHQTKIDTSSFTAKANDWKLFFCIENLKYKQARKIESHINEMRSKKYMEDLKKYPEMSQDLIDRYK